MQVSTFKAIFKADFGRFRPVPAVFRPISVVSAISAASRYGSIWPIQPDFGRISPVRLESKPIRHESSRIVGADLRKKKKNADAVRRAGNSVGRRVPCRAALDAGAAPLVLRPCFLAYQIIYFGEREREIPNEEFFMNLKIW